MPIDRWKIDRRFRGDRTEFNFQYGGTLEDFEFIERTIVDKMGGTVKKRLSGPFSDTVTLLVRGHSIELCLDSPELIFLIPTNQRDLDGAWSIAMELQTLLSTRVPDTLSPLKGAP
jgi:hypothetical protein